MTGDGLIRGISAPPGGNLPIGVQPGVNSAIVIANKVIVFGPGGGVFVYQSGTTPGPGNPPTAWMSSGSTDPYGNALPSTTGVAASGTFQSGDTVINPAGIFTYSGPPAAGNLIASITQTSGTDIYGNPYLGGLTSYQPGAGTAQLVSGQVRLFFGAGGITALTTNGTVLNVGLGAPILMSGVITAGGQIVLTGIATPAGVAGDAVLYAASASGYPKALGSTDANVYHLGAAVHDTFVPQTVNSVTAVQIDGLSHNVLSGQRYKYEAMVIYHGNQNAGSPVISLADPNTNTYTSVAAHEEWSVSGSAPSQTNTDLSFIDVTGPPLTGGRYCYESRGFFQPSANQTFNLFAACTVAADTWVIDAAYLRIEPWT